AGSDRNAGDLAYFIGLYLGDGYYVDRKSYKEKQDFAGFSVKKERKARAIRGALSSLGFEFTENSPNESSEYYRFYLYDKDLLHELRDFGRSYDKHIPNFLFGESKEILRELYKGLIETDGTVQGNKNQEVFYTTSPRLADDFQRLCFLIGKSATKLIAEKSDIRHNDSFVLSVLNEGKDFYLEKDKNISRIPYDGKVFCIEAEHNHILMTRFEGKPVWSGKSWDSFVPHPDISREVFRVLKPGGHAIVFAGTRTQDLMTISLRLAGFEVRDVIEWLYFSGFPKSHNVSKAFDRRAGAKREVVGEYKRPDGGMRDFSKSSEGIWSSEGSQDRTVTAPATELARKWDGWGTSLKPSHEPVIVVRKPLVDADTGRKLTVADCVEKYGTGAINIDASRIVTDEIKKADSVANKGGIFGMAKGGNRRHNGSGTSHEKGRFPANCITLDSDEFYSKYFNVANITPQELSKKASKKDRNSDWKGEEIALEEKRAGGMQATVDGSMLTGSGNERKTVYRNTHPTVKPTDLMAWLVRLITPPNGVVLDPFAGSGSTLVAAKREGFGFIGVELTDEYIPIIEARVGAKATGTKAYTSEGQAKQ